MSHLFDGTQSTYHTARYADTLCPWESNLDAIYARHWVKTNHGILIKDQESADTSTLWQKDNALNIHADRVRVGSGSHGIVSKGLTGTQDLTVGEVVDKTEGEHWIRRALETLAAAKAPLGTAIEEQEILTWSWHDWGDDIFDNWGNFYIFDVATKRYFFPNFDTSVVEDGELTTQTFEAFGRSYTITHGFVAQGIFKFDVSCSDDSEFIFGGYGDMGSDDDTINTNLTQEYTLQGQTFTLYYNRNIEAEDDVERFFSYFVPYNPRLNTSKTYSDFLTNDDELSLFSVPVKHGITVYFSKKNDVKDWVINDLDMQAIALLNVHGDAWVQGAFRATSVDADHYTTRGVDIIAPGTIMLFAGDTTTLPGWIVCDGSLFSAADYPRLFAAIGTKYNGEDDEGTFRVPNLAEEGAVFANAAYIIKI